MNKTLVLDAGGVLATNLSPGLWQQLSDIGQCEQQALYAAYKQEISDDLWRGACTEQQWWEWLSARGIRLSDEQRATLIAGQLRPLPALNKLKAWSVGCKLVIMSNHRSEWLLPLLEPLLSSLHAVHISDQAGLRKPDPLWFEQIDNTLERPADIVFVDDSLKNLQAAERYGWRTLLADEQGLWIKMIDEWLN